ncbi:MAG: beta-lactamase family protein, partial [Verrucomicrobiota bacterium]|nr:beta-lactamase family protein [Verrucomicrobiota bacterium]
GLAVLVARADQVLLRRAWGSAQIELGVALSPDQLFRIGSNSKQFTAAAILELVEAGKLSLTDPLSKFIPDYPNGENITVHQLVNHTSGIFDYTELPGFLKDGHSGRADGDLPTLIATFRDHAPDFPPGTDWKYSSSGYVLLSAIIEKVTGKPWDDVIQQSVITPAGLTHTRVGSDLPIIPGRTAGYSRGEHGEVVNAVYLSMTQPMAAGALVSTVDDLFKWTRALHTGKVLTAERYQQVITPVPNASGKPTDYGYGPFVNELRGEKMLWHGGEIPGFLTVVTYLPKSEVTVIVLCNSDAPERDPETLMRQLAAVAIGHPYPERHPATVTEAQLHQMEGTYQIDEKTRRVLSVRDHQLYSQRGEGEPKRLLAASPDEFYFEKLLDYFAVVRNPAGEVVALDQFISGEPPRKRQGKVSEAPPSAKP